MQPINALATSLFMFSRASLKPCILFKLLFRRRSDHSSGQVFIAMVGTVRPGKNIRAARHCFEKWYDEGKADESAAFWSRFAENVMHHLVWPAVRAGEITQAPNALVDNPTWWTEGIAPILEDERVYSLHWKGSKRKAKSCWTHVCAELGPHDFARVEAREAFRQINAQEFLVAAGYLVEPAASRSTGNEGTQEGEAEVAYATAPAAASPAGDAAAEEAFWKVLADDVMEHLVWPAVHKGCIHAAPEADVD